MPLKASVSVSLVGPSPPVIVSVPEVGPTLIVSASNPPDSRSLPAPLVRMSLPAPPNRVAADVLALALIVSFSADPEIASISAKLPDPVPAPKVPPSAVVNVTVTPLVDVAKLRVSESVPPLPPAMVSLPAFAMMLNVSASLPPDSRSLADPPVIASFPAPPFRVIDAVLPAAFSVSFCADPVTISICENVPVPPPAV